MSSIFHLPQNIRSEFSIDESGKASATQSGVARLCGVSQSAINQLLEKLAISKPISKPLEPFSGIDYRAISKLPDLLVIAIANHYAFYARKTTEQAKSVCLCSQGIGFRVWIRQELGWQEKQKKLSLEEIAFFANFASEAAQNAGVSKAVAESLKLDSVLQFAPAAEALLSQMKNKIYVEIKYFEPEKTKYKEAPRKIDSLYNHPNRFRYTHGYGYGDINSKCQISRIGDTDCYFEFINGECNQFLGEYKANIIKEISREEATGIDRFEPT